LYAGLRGGSNAFGYRSKAAPVSECLRNFTGGPPGTQQANPDRSLANAFLGSDLLGGASAELSFQQNSVRVPAPGKNARKIDGRPVEASARVDRFLQRFI